MLTIKTKIDKSLIHGIGLFSDEFIIKKGDCVWQLDNRFDKVFSIEEFNLLPKITQEYIMHYSHFDKKLNKHILCSDNARFFNKSENPNIGGDNHLVSIALRDIERGEELTEIYYNFNELKSHK